MGATNHAGALDVTPLTDRMKQHICCFMRRNFQRWSWSEEGQVFQCKECLHVFAEPVSVVTVGDENIPHEELQCPRCNVGDIAPLDEAWGWGV